MGEGEEQDRQEKQDPIAKALNPQRSKPGIQLVDEEPHGTKRRATEDLESSSDEDSEDDEDEEEEEEDAVEEIKTIVAGSTRHGKGPREGKQPLIEEVMENKHTPTPETRG